MNELEKTWNEHGKASAERYHIPRKEDILKNPDYSIQWAAQIIDKKSKRLLDDGCGIGQITTAMRILGFKAEGIDISPESVKIGRERGEKITLGDMRNLPFKDNSFDIVIAGGSMEHFPETERGIKEACRVLKTGGFLFGNVPHRYTLFVITKKIQQILGVWKVGYEKSFSISYFKRLLEKDGFKVLEIKRQRIIIGKHKILSRILRLLDEPLYLLGLGGAHFYFKCIKV